MPHIHDVIRERLLHKAGLVELPPPRFTLESFERQAQDQWSPRFEVLMKNRLRMGLLRYGPFGAKGKPYFNMMNSVKKRLDQWEEDGNDEHLVDIANLCMCEFIEGKHPKKHFKAQDEGPGCQQ